MSRPKPISGFTSSVSGVVDAYRAGDYEHALQRCEALKYNSQKTAPYCFFRGGMLIQLGKFSEAEESLREGLQLETNSRARSLVYSQLGTAMLDQEKFKEAIAFFQQSISEFPDRGGSYRAMAEALLRESGNLPEALEQARRAVFLERKDSGLNTQVHNLNLSEALGVLAWAMAENGGEKDAAEILDQAFSLCNPDNVPMLAKLHYHAARTYLLSQMPDKASEHLQNASRLDTQGTFGRLARLQMTG